MQSEPTAQIARDRINSVKKPMGMRERGAESKSQAVGFNTHRPVLETQYSVYQFPAWYLLGDI